MNVNINYASNVPGREKQFPPQDNPPGESNPNPDKPPVEISEREEFEDDWDHDIAVNDFLEYINFIC